MSQQLRRAAQELLNAYDNGCPMHMDWDRLRKALDESTSPPVEEKRSRDADVDKCTVCDRTL